MASGPRVQSTLRAYVRARAAARSTQRRYAVLATAAGVAGLVFAVSQRLPAPVPSTSTRMTFVAAVPDEVTTDFLPLPHGGVPLSDGQLLRVEVPRTALSAFGLATESPELARGLVLADVIVGEDGVARAVRFVRGAMD